MDACCSPDLIIDLSPALALQFDPCEQGISAETASDSLTAEVVAVGIPGRDGSGATDLDLVAETSIGGHRAVAVSAAGEAHHADPTAVGGVPVVGVSVNAATIGGSVSVRTAGVIEESGWSWAQGPVWLGADGVLTQSLPVTGTLVSIGEAIGPTRLRVDPRTVAQL